MNKKVEARTITLGFHASFHRLAFIECTLVSNRGPELFREKLRADRRLKEHHESQRHVY